jgi:hypothetical protein
VVSEGNRRLAADFGEYHRILSRPGQSPSEKNCGGSRKEPGEFNTPPPQVAIATHYQIEDHVELMGLDAVREALASGPIVLGFEVYEVRADVPGRSAVIVARIQ